ncbi:hypothetical protein F4810DRAFT_445780 [Camillea tinctor]|nr:hypothetical protein F4810DRAFT_445780 [Camillea tinctor]
MSRRRNTDASSYSTSTRDSYETRSTAPTSLYDSPRPSSSKGAPMRVPGFQSSYEDEDLSPSTSCYPRSSVETYSSQASYDESEDLDMEDVDDSEIPPLPIYQHEIEETNVRPSNPEDFAALFPSMNRLSIRHDDFTTDGNMNLRVDTVVSGRRRRTIQLFHLRMYDLAKREFSFRRYCRDSGREICNSKRKYLEPSHTARPNLPRSMSNAMKHLAARPQLSRSPTSNSIFPCKSRPGTSHSTAEADDEFTDTCSRISMDKKPKARSVPTNTIKLEFSNYARVDIGRRGSKNAKRYEFEWWGHKYAWRRVVDKLTNTVSFHLMKDGSNNAPIAHIVPETRAPNQVSIDERAGGWVPPCHMWFSDEDMIDAADVADIVVATGLIALVDDCIKERWQSKSKTRRISLPEVLGPKAFVQHIFARRNSDHHSHSPLRHQELAAAC